MNRAERRHSKRGREANSIQAAKLVDGGVRVVLFDDAARPIASMALDRSQAQHFADRLRLVLATGDGGE